MPGNPTTQVVRLPNDVVQAAHAFAGEDVSDREAITLAVRYTDGSTMERLQEAVNARQTAARCVSAYRAAELAGADVGLVYSDYDQAVGLRLYGIPEQPTVQCGHGSRLAIERQLDSWGLVVDWTSGKLVQHAQDVPA